MPLEDLLFLTFIPATIITIVKTIFIAFSVFAVGMIIFLLRKTMWLNFRYGQDVSEFVSWRGLEAPKLTKNWLKITNRLNAGIESEYKLAVIEADSLLDEVLKRMGYSGETLGDRLKQLTPKICPNVDEVREAHQIRSNIVHDPDYRLSFAEAQKVVLIYEQILRSFEVL